MLLNERGNPLFSTGCDSYSEIERQKNYRDFRLMYLNRKWSLNLRDYEGRLFGAERRRIYLMLNFPGLLSRACADLLFGEPCRIVAKDSDSESDANEYLERLILDSDFNTQLYTSEIANSYRGDAIFAMEIRNNVGRLKTIPACNYYIRANPDDPTEATVEYVAWKTNTLSGDHCVRISEYGEGYIQESAFYCSEKEKDSKNWVIGAQISLDLVYAPGEGPAELTEFDRSLGRMIQHIPNFHDDEQYFGFSDYPDLVPIFEAINNRISNLDAYLDTHSRPKLIGASGLSDMFGNFDFAADYIEPNDTESGKNIRYLTWDGKSDTSLLQLEYLEDKFFQISEMSQAIFGVKITGGIDSAMAMRQFFVRTKAKINRKRMLYDGRLKAFITKVSRFFESRGVVDKSGEYSAVALDGVEIYWQDGIPRDYLEAIDAEARRVNAGLSSVSGALQRLELTGREEADREIALILEERSKGVLPPVGKPVDTGANGGGVVNTPAIQ